MLDWLTSVGMVSGKGREDKIMGSGVTTCCVGSILYSLSSYKALLAARYIELKLNFF